MPSIFYRVSADGAFRIINGTCAHTDEKRPLAEENKCPVMKDQEIKCAFNSSNRLHAHCWAQFLALVLILKWLLHR